MNPDWTEDFAHENGNYSCLCCRCGQAFVGHKRRVICKACFTESAAPTPAPDAAVATVGESLLREPVTIKAPEWYRCDAHAWLSQIPCPTCNMVVTRDGKTVADQAQAIRDFADAARVKPAPDAADDIVRRLQGYNPPDRTVPSQQRIAQDIMEAAAAIVALRAEVARLKEALRELVECKDLGIAATRKLHEDAGSIQHGRIMNEEAKQMDAEYSRRIGPAWHAARAALEQP